MQKRFAEFVVFGERVFKSKFAEACRIFLEITRARRLDFDGAESLLEFFQFVACRLRILLRLVEPTDFQIGQPKFHLAEGAQRLIGNVQPGQGPAIIFQILVSRIHGPANVGPSPTPRIERRIDFLVSTLIV